MKIPTDVVSGQQFSLSGAFWQDPGIEFELDPSTSSLTVVDPTSGVSRTIGDLVLGVGETTTVTLTPTGVGDFYAAREDMGCLVLLPHDADAFENGVFIRLDNSPINYTDGLPESAGPGSTIDISGMYWEDPGLKHLVTPHVS